MTRLLMPMAFEVRQDEPCVLLAELNLPTPGNQGQRRYQITVVVRNDRPAEHRISLGPVTRQEQFRIMGSIETGNGRTEVLHTVAELREIANHLRERLSGWSRQIEPQDLVTLYRNHMEELPLRLRRVSVSGPQFTVSRN